MRPITDVAKARDPVVDTVPGHQLDAAPDLAPVVDRAGQLDTRNSTDARHRVVEIALERVHHHDLADGTFDRT